jgi:anion-transporting  ArsA/GET3 family ATPase
MNNVLDQEYKQAKEVFTKPQEKALAVVVKKEEEIHKTQEEIEKVLKENNLNILDVDKYKHEKNIDKFLKLEFPH